VEPAKLVVPVKPLARAKPVVLVKPVPPARQAVVPPHHPDVRP
jgi:hypothetical protein